MAAIILSGSAVQTKGFGCILCSFKKRLIDACRSKIERKTPRFNRRLVSVAKNPSTALSHEHEVGVKWKVNRFAVGNLRFDGVKEADELLMPMTLHVTANNRAIEDVQRREQRRCPVPL